MEYLDIVDENGIPSGETVSREEAHRLGVQHRTSHVWIVRKTDNGYDILLQKRSLNKDSHPGMFDTSSAGHIVAGDEPLESALRELDEELGIKAGESELKKIGIFHGEYSKEFHGRLFKDNEISFVFIYQGNVDIDNLVLQKSEIDEVRWFDLDKVWEEIQLTRKRICVPSGSLEILRKYLWDNPCLIH